MGRHVVGNVTEVQPGERKIIQTEGRSIGVFNVKGTYYALRNNCPHQGAPLCKGHVTGMTLTAPPGQYVYGRSGEILRCPWHGWEFDILTGKSIYDPNKCLVRTYDVTVEWVPGSTLTAESEIVTEEAETQTQIDTYPVTVEDGLIILHV
jgi:nitrite reductase (NADH) small subunit